MDLFGASGYYEGSRSEWRRGWMMPLFSGAFIGLVIGYFFGTVINHFSLMSFALGLGNFLEKYACGIGTFGICTDQKPAEFWGEEKK